MGEPSKLVQLELVLNKGNNWNKLKKGVFLFSL